MPKLAGVVILNVNQGAATHALEQIRDTGHRDAETRRSRDTQTAYVGLEDKTEQKG